MNAGGRRGSCVAPYSHVSWPTIVKIPRLGEVPPNLDDYERLCATFSWDQARATLDGLPHGRGLNIAYEAIDRHALSVRARQRAIRWLGKNGRVLDFTYGDLCDLTNRFANVLDRLGVAPGDRVAVLAGRIPELYVAGLGTMKHRSVFSPLFSAFGPEPIGRDSPSDRRECW
jgi:acetyl-CoA synthetase